MSDNEHISQSSKKISELSSIDVATDTTYFVLQRGETSYKISYADLKSYIYSNIDQIINVGSMAYCETSQYSPFAHGHGYTDFWFFPTYGSQYKDIEGYEKTGTFKITKYLPGPNQSSSYTIESYVPYRDEFKNELVSYEPRKAGDLQFLALGKNFETYLTRYRKYSLKTYGSLKNIDIMADSFDGYVIPNGTTFTCQSSQFKEACKTYAGNENATSFTVPKLDSFFRCNPGTQMTDAMKHFEHQNGISSHNHQGKIQTDYTDDYDILNLNLGRVQQFTASTGKAVRGYVHGGKGKDSGDSRFNISKIVINADVSSLDVKQAGTDEESYPAYNDVQVLLYIGGR